MAVLQVNVIGGGFDGGYISVNGEKDIHIYDGFYDLPNGDVHIDFFNESRSIRSFDNHALKTQIALNDGSFISNLSTAVTASGMYKHFEVSLTDLTELSVVDFTVKSPRFGNIKEAPVYKVYETTHEELERMRFARAAEEEYLKDKKKKSAPLKRGILSIFLSPLVGIGIIPGIIGFIKGIVYNHKSEKCSGKAVTGMVFCIIGIVCSLLCGMFELNINTLAEHFKDYDDKDISVVEVFEVCLGINDKDTKKTVAAVKPEPKVTEAVTETSAAEVTEAPKKPNKTVDNKKTQQKTTPTVIPGGTWASAVRNEDSIVVSFLSIQNGLCNIKVEQYYYTGDNGNYKWEKSSDAITCTGYCTAENGKIEITTDSSDMYVPSQFYISQAKDKGLTATTAYFPKYVLCSESNFNLSSLCKALKIDTKRPANFAFKENTEMYIKALGGLFLREKPTTNSNFYILMDDGATVVFHGEYATDEIGRRWGYVTYKDSQDGWCCMDYVFPEK